MDTRFTPTSEHVVRCDIALGEVHVWTALMHTCGDMLRRLRLTLSTDELNKAAKYRFEKHRREYIFSQGILRHILSRYVSALPQQLQFQRNDFGKPSLEGAGHLHFNMSNSQGCVVIAVAREGPIGVDVEHIRSIPDIDSIAEHYFSSEERTLVRSAAAADRETVFYSCWTRKEAFIKAVGRGLSIPLGSFDTAMPRDTSERFLSFADNSELDVWWLADIPVPPGYAGALAVKRDRLQVKLMELKAGSV